MSQIFPVLEPGPTMKMAGFQILALEEQTLKCRELTDSIQCLSLPELYARHVEEWAIWYKDIHGTDWTRSPGHRLWMGNFI
jgi:hypothetical protein